MPNVKTAISLEEGLFDQVEEVARDLKLPRSQVIALALEEFLHRRESQRMLEAINATMGEEPDPEEQEHLRAMLELHRRAIERGTIEGDW